jgi:hypothetical protein
MVIKDVLSPCLCPASLALAALQLVAKVMLVRARLFAAPELVAGASAPAAF